jgi:hypothetical protein
VKNKSADNCWMCYCAPSIKFVELSYLRHFILGDGDLPVEGAEMLELLEVAARQQCLESPAFKDHASF